MMKVLFVCTGNTCRSSMAEGIAKALLKDKRINGIEVLSAGTMALPGSPASEFAVDVLKDMGIDISEHKASMVDSDILEEVNLILTMTKSHYYQLLQLNPGIKEKVFTLGEYVGIEGDIPDPIGGPKEVYDGCAQVLKQLINMAFNKIEKTKGKKTEESTASEEMSGEKDEKKIDSNKNND